MIVTQIAVGRRDEDNSYITFYYSDSTNPNSKETKVINIQDIKLGDLINAIKRYQEK